MERWQQRLSYGVSDLACNLVLTLMSSYVLIFYTDVFSIGTSAAGSVMLAARLIDAVMVVLLGIAIDRTHTRWGKSRPYFLFGAVPFGLAVVLAFWAPELPASARVVYAFVAYTLLSVMYSLVNLPVSSITPALTTDPWERSLLVTTRMICAMVGVTIVSTATSPLIAALGGGDDRRGYRTVAVIIGAAAALMLLGAFVFIREKVPAKPPVKGDVLGDFKAMDGQCVLFAMIGVVFYIAYCFRGASILYYFTYNLQRPDLIPMIGIFGTLSGLPALLAAPYVLKHITRRLAMFLSVLTYALGTLLLAFGPFSAALYGGLVLTGMGFYMVQMVNFSTGPDVIDYCRCKSGRDIAGTYSALSTSISKLSMGLGSFGVGLLLKYGGYQEGAAAQTAQALGSIKAGFVWIQLFICAVVLVMVPFYRLDKEMPAVRAALAHEGEETAR